MSLDILKRFFEKRSRESLSKRLTKSKLFKYSLFLAYGILLISLLGGLPYVIFYAPPSLYRGSSSLEITFVSPDRMGQGPIETFYIGLFYSLGIAGLLFVQHSTQRRLLQQRYLFLLAGIALVAIAAYGLFWIGIQKYY
ncbi:MAG: hypothetical protein QW201_02455 [Thermoproteota archaeon]